jgi:hypothetical protein
MSRRPNPSAINDKSPCDTLGKCLGLSGSALEIRFH